MVEQLFDMIARNTCTILSHTSLEAIFFGNNFYITPPKDSRFTKVYKIVLYLE
jgi:hypothetical protein